jgi:hypothetical protein
MAQQYSIDNLSQLSQSAGNIPFIYDRDTDTYRPMEQGDFSFFNSENAASQDAFGRLRVSNPFTLFDSSHRYADNGLWVSASGVSGNSSFNSNQGLINLNVTNASGSYISRETTKVFAYQPGKSLLNLNTFVMSPAKTNLRQRIGYFSTLNGFYIELDDNILSIVKRTSVGGSVSEEKIPQSQWNSDKLDGTDSSGITLDITKAQILWMDLEWLGVGSVRVGFVINGKFILCHTFHHANIIDSTYITTASLPIRYEIENKNSTTGSSTLKQICSTVLSEGGYELRGAQREVDLPLNVPRICTSANVNYPAISLRLKTSPNRLDSIAILSALNILGDGNNSIFSWKIVANGTTSGGSWVSASTDSSVEYNISGTSFSIGSGRILAGGYFTSNTQSNPPVYVDNSNLFKFQLERNSFTSTPYELTLLVAAKVGGDTVYATIDWEEISR